MAWKAACWSQASSFDRKKEGLPSALGAPSMMLLGQACASPSQMFSLRGPCEVGSLCLSAPAAGGLSRAVLADVSVVLAVPIRCQLTLLSQLPWNLFCEAFKSLQIFRLDTYIDSVNDFFLFHRGKYYVALHVMSVKLDVS